MTAAPALSTHPFDADTAVTPVREDTYRATISDRWTALTGAPNGGYLLATCVNALRHAMPYPDPMVISGHFLRKGTVGPAEVRTELARSGRRLATGEARLIQDGVEVVRVVASFGDLARSRGRTVVLSEPPALPSPRDAIDPLGGTSLPGVSIADRVEFRMAEVPGWLRGEPSGDPTAQLWLRFKEEREPDLLALAMLVDAAAPAVTALGVPSSATIQLTVHLRGHPAPGWLACRVATRHVIDGYHEEDFEIWDSEGRLVAQARQFAVLS